MSTFVEKWLNGPVPTECGLHSGDDPADLRYRSWARLRQDARTLAAGLATAGVGHGGRVAILADDPGDVADLVQATWTRGAAFTMLHQPTPRADLEAWLEDTRAVISLLGADVLVVGGIFADSLNGQDVGTRVVSVADLVAAGEAGEGPDIAPVPVVADDVAILQLTSGSTGIPKAVVITFGNVEANQDAMTSALELTDKDVTVSWLPLFHDMGMIGLLLMPMLAGVAAVVTTPRAFLVKPQVWAELIHRYRGTCTAAPNFAYALLAKRLRRAGDGAFDLSSLRIAINGAEPIDATSMHSLLVEGARFALAPEALMPCYGMAETTLAVSFDSLTEHFTADTIDAGAAETSGEIRHDVQEGNRRQAHVRVGRPVPGIEVTVTDEGRPLPADRIGTLLVRGAAVTTRYLAPDGFADAVDADGWLDTGDLGYLTDTGEVVVTGRKKDVIIVSGRNIAPAVIERAACTVEGVRPGNAAAVPYPRPDGREGIAVIAEIDPAIAHDEQAADQRIHDEIVRAVFDAVGVPVSVVTLISKGEMPKTTSGKIRRHAAAGLVTKVGA